MTDEPAEVAALVPTTEPDPYPRYTLAQRKQLIATLPWIAARPAGLDTPACGKLISRAPSWARALDYRVRQGIATPTERADLIVWRCNVRAPYVYLTLNGQMLDVCYPHASYYLGASMAEHERYRAWVDAHPLAPS